MARSDFLYRRFLECLPYEPTFCQDGLFRKVADFLTADDTDLLVVNGYAGTGKTTALSAVIRTMRSLETPCVLLAPTGRAFPPIPAFPPIRSISIFTARNPTGRTASAPFPWATTKRSRRFSSSMRFPS